MEGSNLTKEFTTFREQLNILKSRNLIIKDDDFAVSVLKSINYYRFTGYLIPFKTADGKYKKGTTFDQIYNIYEFDRRLRLLLLELIESIELKFRVAVSHYFSEKNTPTAYEHASYFVDESKHKKFYDQYIEYRNKSNELFIKHYLSNGYDIPFWVAVEIIPFGSLSMLYANMNNDDKSYIATKAYNSKPYLINSYMHTFSTLRNACTHFNRIYDKSFPIKPKIPTPISKKFNPSFTMYKILLVMKSLLDNRLFMNSMINLNVLITEYSESIALHRIGLPQNWYNELTTKSLDSII
ncbi:Abi family protein [Salicibibacter cibarius]|uniref:Abi family protein n=1 Tax=Salicibibacter cibarius TaxID=2743000 RepID=A0A7T6Z733_9BACI|nr:Abi family protein [Salicibibacter cibarius]QQK78038.1 Abi family protein [Salicibibacter cibarius]